MKLTLSTKWFESEIVGSNEGSVTAGNPDPGAFAPEAVEPAQGCDASAWRASTFAALINLKRRASHLSLESLAERAGIGVAELRSIEQCDAGELELRTVASLAAALRLPADHLYRYYGRPAPTSRVNDAPERYAPRPESAVE